MTGKGSRHIRKQSLLYPPLVCTWPDHHTWRARLSSACFLSSTSTQKQGVGFWKPTMRCRGMGCCGWKLKPMPAARRTPSGQLCLVGGPMSALILCSSSICTSPNVSLIVRGRTLWHSLTLIVVPWDTPGRSKQHLVSQLCMLVAQNQIVLPPKDSPDREAVQ